MSVLKGIELDDGVKYFVVKILLKFRGLASVLRRIYVG